MNVKIQRQPSGAVLGAVLWIPASVIEQHVSPGQEEIEISFEGDRIIIGKDENPVVQAGREHQAGTLNDGLLLSEA